MNPRSKFQYEQEKEQVIGTRSREDDHSNQWVDQASQRRVTYAQRVYMPPDIKGEKTRNIPLVHAGETDPSGLPENYSQGYIPWQMSPSDPPPTNEIFYEEIVDPETGEASFLERGNTLDRN